jgi:hypothetical protein
MPRSPRQDRNRIFFRRTARAAIGAAGVLGVLAAWLAAKRPAHQRPTIVAEPTATATAAPQELERPAKPAVPPALRWLAIGGGADPVSNQVSIAQNVAMARDVLGLGGWVLFAGGAGRSPVLQLDDELHADPLIDWLGRVLDPRGGRDAGYEEAPVLSDGPATEEVVWDVLSAALDDELAGPLTIYLAAHGDRGDEPKQGFVQLWGGWALGVDTLAAALDDAKRPVRLIVSACFAGGFADVIFQHASASAGAAAGTRCGFFASTWDRPANGCDPDPERGRQEGYSIHFLEALRGQDRAGAKASDIDLDRDGRVSFYEAHTRARIASRSIDVPTTTSERWLRHAAPLGGPHVQVSLPEEAAVVAALERRLALGGDAAAAARLAELEERLAAAEAELEAREEAAEAQRAALRTALLERWPLLDDPWHPRFAAVLRDQRAAIVAFLEQAPENKAWHEARMAADRAGAAASDLEVKHATVARLARAYETIVLAGQLAAAGGDGWARYQALLACERGTSD